MRWTPGRMALLTSGVFVALVAVGVGYVANADLDRGSLVAGSSATTAPAPRPVATPSPQLTSAEPPAGVTLTARPTPKATRKPKVRLKPLPTATPTPTPTPQPPPTLDFTLSSFNVLGASHTGGRGKRPGMAPGRVRAGRAAQLIRRHGSDVVGFQELQGSQLATLQRTSGMDFYPGFSLGHLGTDNSIGWRRDRWMAVERHTVNIPYFNGGPRAMPFVRLRSIDTGIEAWFANFHNPAETAHYHHQQRFRSAATRIESNLANRLITSQLPVFLTGDMNEQAPYFCRLTSQAPMVAARGGTNNGRCLAGRPRAVDWIFGSQGVDFTGYFEDRSHLVDITTDHPVLVARVHLVGKTPRR